MVLIVILGFIVPRIDWVGHLVGLLTGGGVGYLLIREGGLRPRVHTALFVAAVVVTVVCIGLGLSFCINHPPPLLFDVGVSMRALNANGELFLRGLLA